MFLVRTFAAAFDRNQSNVVPMCIVEGRRARMAAST